MGTEVIIGFIVTIVAVVAGIYVSKTYLGM